MLLATAAACGTVQNLTAGQKVDQAVDRLGEQKSLALELDLDADSDALTALAGEAGSEEELPPEFAKLLAGLRVEVSVKSKKPLADSGEKDLVGMSARVEGPEGVLVEYRVVGDFTYYRADFKAMGEAMGVPMPTADQIPESEKEFRKVLEGEWVKIDTSALEKAQKSESSRAAPTGSTPRPSRRSSMPYVVSSPTRSPSAPRTAATVPNTSSPRATSVICSPESSTSSDRWRRPPAGRRTPHGQGPQGRSEQEGRGRLHA